MVTLDSRSLRCYRLALAVFTGLALLRPLFDREGRTTGVALVETWPTPPA